MKRYVDYKNLNRDVKNLKEWTQVKGHIYKMSHSPYFREGEVWWASIGFNIGDEQNGKNKNFERPVLILKRYYKNLFLGLPLSSIVKQGDYYYRKIVNHRDGIIILSQGRVIDAKRLIRRIEVLDEKSFKDIVKKYKELI